MEHIDEEHELFESFKNLFQHFGQVVYKDNAAKGFWTERKIASFNVTKNTGVDVLRMSDMEQLGLIQTEVAEAMEARRNGNPPDKHLPDFSALEVELADACIRILDMAAGRGLDVAGAIVGKVRFNRTRPHKHGKGA